jgi:hypothetical protein
MDDLKSMKMEEINYLIYSELIIYWYNQNVVIT